MRIEDIKIDDDFKTLCPELQSDELRRLRENIIKDGEFREPVIVWRSEGILIDGHNRLSVWGGMTDEERQRIAAPRIKLIDFDSRGAVHNWIISNQLGRRNLDQKQKSYLVGKWYQAEKKEPHRPANKKGDTLSPLMKTSEKIAEKTGQSPRQVNRDAQFTEAVDTLVSNIGPEVKAELLTDKKIGKARVVEIAALPADRQKAEYDRAMGKGEPSPGITFDPSEWGGMEPVADPVIPTGTVTEHHVKEMQAPWREFNRLMTAVKKVIEDLPEGTAGAWCDQNQMADIMGCYSNLRSTVNHRKPVAICGHCNGLKCDRCYQTGALNKDLSEALREGTEATGVLNAR
ncbi:hypothetical protein Pan153_33940 [Gimesia panareensis]|uniref:ParB-like nuclease domain protein n=1 Tax=Gimesia panareensis TaxID=2527978 RepID=A0A518FQW0_9PLAN|nr:hypothetical protein [Gimesia panareensis]QDV18733.1 hypothetical protein Pan153_33940 [Gimesia panareensis]